MLQWQTLKHTIRLVFQRTVFSFQILNYGQSIWLRHPRPKRKMNAVHRVAVGRNKVWNKNGDASFVPQMQEKSARTIANVVYFACPTKIADGGSRAAEFAKIGSSYLDVSVV